MVISTRYILVTPDRCSTYQGYSDAILAWLHARETYDAVLLIQFGGMKRSRRIAEKWSHDGWDIGVQNPLPP